MISLTFLYWIAGLLGLGFVALLIYVLLTKVKEGDDPENEIIIENFMPQYSQGYSEGIVKEMDFGEERIRIVFCPRDINYIRTLKNKETIEPVEIFFDKRQVVPSNISSHRQKIKCFPNDISLLPEEFKRTPYGKKVMEMIQDNNKLKDESELLSERMINLREITSKTFGGGIFKDYVDKSKEIMKDVKESSSTEIIKKDEKK